MPVGVGSVVSCPALLLSQSLRKLCVPQQRSYRPGRAPKTMAVKHMAFFQGAQGAAVGGGLGSVTDMWGDGVVSC